MVRRRLFTLLSAASLVLCAAAVALWVRSYQPSAVVDRFSLLGGSYAIHTLDGHFAVLDLPAGAFRGTDVLTLHFATVLVATLVLPAAVTMSRLRASRRGRVRRLAGHCLRCGYDLRATPDRCPECGEPAADADAASESANNRAAA